MLRTLSTTVILILLGLIVGLNLQATPPASTLSAAALSTTAALTADANLDKRLSLLQTQITQLEAKLNTEVEKHKKTSIQLNELKQALALTTKTKTTDTQQAKNANTGDNASGNTKKQLTESQQNRKTLISIGIDDGSADRIQQLAEKKEMDQLYLRNTAAREGWFGTEKYFEKTRELDLSSNIYREELGDDKYDQFLYSSNRANRITVQSILSESPAENSGLQPGDYILSYDNRRVFNWTDLTSLTTNGEVGESVSIEVQRNDQTFQYFIVRGPLGIRLNSERVNPSLP